MVDLKGQYEGIKTEVNEAIAEILDSSAFINGPHVQAFQNELQDYLGVKHVIPCANGNRRPPNLHDGTRFETWR